MRAGKVQSDHFDDDFFFVFFNILSQYILRKRGQKAGRLSWVETIMFSNSQAIESFLSASDKTGFCHNSDEGKKNFLGQDVNFPLLFSLGKKVSLNWSWPELLLALSLNNELSQVMPKLFPSATHCQTRGKWLQGGTLLCDMVIACCRPFCSPVSCPRSWDGGNAVTACPQGVLPPPAYVEHFLAPSYRILL